MRSYSNLLSLGKRFFLLRIYNIKNANDILDSRMMVVNHFKEA